MTLSDNGLCEIYKKLIRFTRIPISNRILSVWYTIHEYANNNGSNPHDATSNCNHLACQLIH